MGGSWGAPPTLVPFFFLRKRGREDREEEKERGREGYKKRGLIFSFYWYDVLYF